MQAALLLAAAVAVIVLLYTFLAASEFSVYSNGVVLGIILILTPWQRMLEAWCGSVNLVKEPGRSRLGDGESVMCGFDNIGNDIDQIDGVVQELGKECITHKS